MLLLRCAVHKLEPLYEPALVAMVYKRNEHAIEALRLMRSYSAPVPLAAALAMVVSEGAAKNINIGALEILSRLPTMALTTHVVIFLNRLSLLRRFPGTRDAVITRTSGRCWKRPCGMSRCRLKRR
jgi:hypothetical protein